MYRSTVAAKQRRPQARLLRAVSAECPERTSSPERKTLVWIDDYEPGLALYKLMFENLGYRVLTASRGKAGLDLIRSNAVDAVVVDYEMPEMDGEAVASHIKQSDPTLPVVMFTASDIVPHRVRSLVDALCHKTGSCDQLTNTVQQALLNRPVPSAACAYAA
ncbi:MAG: response regulator [Acidobacteriales bacterium]|nr:response regulator [Terriglobales bacterium]